MKKLLSVTLASFSMIASSALAIPTFVDSYGGFDYYLTDDAMSWTDAQAQAETINGNLTSIHSAAENAFVNGIAATVGGTVWIGINDIDTEGDFVWSDGSEVTYENWSNGEPNDFNQGNPGEDVTALGMLFTNNSGEWNDLSDDYTSNYQGFPNGFYGVIKKASVPESGASIALLGLGLLSLFGAKRFKR